MHSSLQEEAGRLLSANAMQDRGYYFVAPSKRKYSHQFSWDSAFHAIANCGLGRVDPARREIMTLLSCMLPDGTLPHLIFHDPSRASPIIRLFRRSIWPQPYRSPLVQPPIVALAVREIWRRSEDAGFLREALPLLQRHFEWLETRRLGDSGLLSTFSPWESGQDHKPGFDRYLGRLRRVPLGFHMGLYLSEIRLSCHGYDPAEVVKRGYFNVREVLFNTAYVLGLEALTEMSLAVGETAAAERFRKRGERVEKAILDECHDAGTGLYFDVDAHTGQRIAEPSISCLMPLALGGIPEPRRDGLLRHLKNSGEFWLPFPVPSLPKSSRYFRPEAQRLLWRGPTWINTNWLLLLGLRRHGYSEIADAVARSSRELVERAGFWEYYNPLTGEGEGERDFSSSTLAAIM